MPERPQEARAAAALQPEGQRLRDGEVPGRDGHDEQDHQDGFADAVGLREEMGKAHGLRWFHSS